MISWEIIEIIQGILIELGNCVLSTSLYLLIWFLVHARLPKNMAKVIFISFTFNFVCRDLLVLKSDLLFNVLSEEFCCLLSTILGGFNFHYDIDKTSIVDSIYYSSRKFRISYFNKFSICVLIILLSLGIAGVKYIYSVYGIIDMNNIANVFITENKFNIVQFKGIIIEYFTKFGFRSLLTSMSICYIICKYFPFSLKFSLCECKLKIKVKSMHITIMYVLSFLSMAFFIYQPLKFSDSNFMLENYVKSEGLVSFGDNKRNIILIFLESMESTYTSRKSGGFYEESLIPNLERLANDKNNIHFTHDPEKIGGPKEMTRMSYTSGATYAMLCGDYLGRPIGVKNNYFRPELKCLTDILKENGYNLVAIYPTSYYSCNQGYLFLSHSMKRDDLVDSLVMNNSDEWISDHIMFDYAKREILQKSQENSPFLAIMMTMDTHFPGFRCKYCNKTDNELFDAIRCSDRQVLKFIEWAKSQRFYENTTIIIHGDHEYMGYKIRTNGSYERRVFNLIINPKTDKTGKIIKNYTLFDIFPTALSLAGAKITGEKLGLGTNLLSDEPNLLKKYTFEYLNRETTKENIWFNAIVLKRPPPGELGFSIDMTGYKEYTLQKTSEKSDDIRKHDV